MKTSLSGTMRIDLFKFDEYGRSIESARHIGV